MNNEYNNRLRQSILIHRRVTVVINRVTKSYGDQNNREHTHWN